MGDDGGTGVGRLVDGAAERFSAWVSATSVRLRASWLPSRGVLRRGSDRVELLARWTALLVVVMSIPVLLATGTMLGTAAEARDAVARATSGPVAATLVADPVTRVDNDGNAATTRRSALLRWSAPDGGTRLATADVAADTARGATVTIWVDHAGVRVPPPPAPGRGTAEGYLEAAVLLAIEIALAWAGLVALRWLLDRSRYRTWDREWAELAPRDGRHRG